LKNKNSTEFLGQSGRYSYNRQLWIYLGGRCWLFTSTGTHAEQRSKSNGNSQTFISLLFGNNLYDSNE